MDATVVIATYNREALLKKCLEHLFEQDYPKDKYEIVIVDDCSTDGTAEMIRNLNPPCRLAYIANTKTLGPSIARNKAITEATGEIVIFIDSDAFAPPWYIREHVETHKNNPGIIMDGPIINLTRKEDIQAPPFLRWDIKTMAFLDFGGVYFITANASCPRKSLESAGGFDEEFVWAWEDVELGTRLMESGLKRIKNRRAYVLHCKVGKYSLQSQAAFRKERAEYAGKFFCKHPSAMAKRMVRLRYLKYDRLFERMGWVRRYLNEEYISSSGGRLPAWPPMLKKFYLIHAHAEGLRKGLGITR